MALILSGNGDITGLDPALFQSNEMGYTPAGTGAVATTVQAKLRESVSVNDFGADPTGSTDSLAAFVAAIAATPTGSTLRLNGYYRLSAALTINKTMSIVGVDSRVSNVTSGANSKSFMFFYTDTNGIIVDGCVVSIDSLIISGPGSTSTRYGVSTINVNNSVVIQNSVIQSFSRGINLTQGYYNKFLNTTLTFCQYGINADNCYNISAEGLQINCDPTLIGVGIQLVNGSSMTLSGGSIENFGGISSFGVGLFNGSSFSCFGTYFEGDVARPTGWNIYLDANASFVGIGCHVYMTGCARHISTSSGAATGTRVLSQNNRFIYPTDAQVCAVYRLLNTDSTADWRISGDNWNTGAGVNTRYMETDSGSVTYGVGNFNIIFPSNHPQYGKNLVSTPIGDYGNWTPVLSSDGTPPTVSSYAVQIGTYSKIGNRVFISCHIRATISSIGTGTPRVSGLPFSAIANLQGVSLGVVSILTSPAASGNYIQGSNVVLSGTYNTAATSYLTFSAQYEV